MGIHIFEKRKTNVNELSFILYFLISLLNIKISPLILRRITYLREKKAFTLYLKYDKYYRDSADLPDNY